MNSVAAEYMTIDQVELLVIAENLSTDRCTDHQSLTKLFGWRRRRQHARANNQQPRKKSKAKGLRG
jgi:hypothetical protein